MLKNKSGGFTLIEITIVLAITASMFVMVLAWQGAVRSQSEFTTTADTVVADFEAARNAAATSDNSTGTGDNTSQILFAKLIMAHKGDSFITITDVYGNTTLPQTQQSNCSGLIETLSRGPSQQINLSYGITVENPSSNRVQVAFHRQLCGGQLLTYVLPSTWSAPINQGNYSESMTPPQIAAQTATVGLTDPNGRIANINIDGSNNGAINVSYP